MPSSESISTIKYHVPLNPIQVALIAAALDHAEDKTDNASELGEIVSLKTTMRRLLVD